MDTMKRLLQHKYRFFADPGHGWLEVPRWQIDALGIAGETSAFSYQFGTLCYLEEDRDASRFVKAWEADTGQTWDDNKVSYDYMSLIDSRNPRNFKRFQS